MQLNEIGKATLVTFEKPRKVYIGTLDFAYAEPLWKFDYLSPVNAAADQNGEYKVFALSLRGKLALREINVDYELEIRRKIFEDAEKKVADNPLSIDCAVEALREANRYINALKEYIHKLEKGK